MTIEEREGNGGNTSDATAHVAVQLRLSPPTCLPEPNNNSSSTDYSITDSITDSNSDLACPGVQLLGAQDLMQTLSCHLQALTERGSGAGGGEREGKEMDASLNTLNLTMNSLTEKVKMSMHAMPCHDMIMECF